MSWKEQRYEPMPDHYGTGRQPYRKKPLIPLTLLLLALLVGTNLISVAFLMGYNVGKKQTETASAPSSATEESPVQATPDPALLASGLRESLAEVWVGDSSYVGIVLSSDGHILTTAGPELPERVTVNGKSYTEIRPEGAAPRLGLAVIKIDTQGLQPVSMGLCGIPDSSEEQLLRYGDPLSAEGGAVQWLSRVHLVERNLEGRQHKVLEGDYAPGDLLLNSQGQLVALCVSTEEGILALPVEELLNLTAELMAFGTLGSPLATGVELSLLEEAQRLYWDLPGNLMFSHIPQDSFAYEAGLREGDVLLRIDGMEIGSPAELWGAIAACKDKAVVSVTIYRDSSELELLLRLK